MSYLGVPIFAGDRAIGVISVQSIREEGRFVEADARLLDTIASNVGGAIQNARLFAEVERQREHFESLVEISPVAVVVMDAEERVTGWNPAAAELFGHTAEEAVGRQIDDLVFGDDIRDEGRDITREALADGRAHRITQAAAQGRDGGRRRAHARPVDRRRRGASASSGPTTTSRSSSAPATRRRPRPRRRAPSSRR